MCCTGLHRDLVLGRYCVIPSASRVFAHLHPTAYVLRLGIMVIDPNVQAFLLHRGPRTQIGSSGFGHFIRSISISHRSRCKQTHTYIALARLGDMPTLIMQADKPLMTDQACHRLLISRKEVLYRCS